MEFFIADAFAQNGAQQGFGLNMFLMIGVFFVIMYFMIIRPQSKQAKEHKKLMESLSKGDEVVTSGGFMGKIAAVGEQTVQVELTEGVTVKLQKHAVTKLLPKGTLKNA
jgi:preprotein translocase subunit YajC